MTTIAVLCATASVLATVLSRLVAKGLLVQLSVNMRISPPIMATLPVTHCH